MNGASGFGWEFCDENPDLTFEQIEQLLKDGKLNVKINNCIIAPIKGEIILSSFEETAMVDGGKADLPRCDDA